MMLPLRGEICMGYLKFFLHSFPSFPLFIYQPLNYICMDLQIFNLYSRLKSNAKLLILLLTLFQLWLQELFQWLLCGTRALPHSEGQGAPS